MTQMSERTRPKIYLAGPDVFSPNVRQIRDQKMALCEEFGFTGLFPLDQELDISGLDPQEAGRAIFLSNISMMHRADAVIANLTPFRGPSGDSGTCFEVGFMHALNRPVFAYSNDARTYLLRTRDWFNAERDEEGLYWDDNGHMIEAFGMADNLMMVGACLEAGSNIAAPKDSPPYRHQKTCEPSQAPIEGIEGFRQCLVRAQAWFRQPRSNTATTMRPGEVHRV